MIIYHKRFAACRRTSRGTVLIEYGMLCALVALTAIVAISGFSSKVVDIFDAGATIGISGSDPGLNILMEWGFTSGTDGIAVGFLEGGYGTLDQTDTRLGAVKRIYEYGSDYSYLHVRGNDQSAIFQDLLLDCNGTSWSLSESLLITYDTESYGGSTVVIWSETNNGSDRPAFEEAQRYDCYLAETP